MTSFLLRHPRWGALLILLAGALLAFLSALPGLHNDDMQQYFTICNGGVGEATPFALHCNVLFGYTVRGLAALFPGFNGYLAFLLVVISVSLFTVNEFVLRHRAWDGEGPLSGLWLWVAVLFLLYINQECLRDQQVQYTHVSLMAGVAAAMVLYDALCRRAGWKRVVLGAWLFMGMYVLRPEALMSFVFMAGGSVLAWLCVCGISKPSRAAVYLVSAMAVCFVAGIGADRATFAAHPDWDDALTYRKLRVNIQDYADNSKLEKSADLTAAGIDPVEFSVFKTFTYVPTMDDMGKIRAARDIHQKGCHGLFGVDSAVKVGLLQLDAGNYTEIYMDGVFLTPFVPLALVTGLFVLAWRGRAARAVLPALACVAAYVVVLLLSARYSGRVSYPAAFWGAAWVLAFLPADARIGRYAVLRWGMAALCLCCYAFCMRHYSFASRAVPAPEQTAAGICAAHPECTYLSLTIQRSPLFSNGLFSLSRTYWETSNIVPISDGWIFYTPAYRAYLQARGISNPYLCATRPDVYFLVKDATGPDVLVLRCTKQMYHFYTGRQLTFRKVWEDRSISCWKAEELPVEEQ